MVQVLQPLEVGGGDTSGVAKDVRQELDASGEHFLFGAECGGAVGALDDQLGLEFVAVVEVDGLLKGSWHEEVAKLCSTLTPSCR